MASKVIFRRASLLNVTRLARCCQPAAVTWSRSYVLKTAGQLEEKKRRALLGGGQKRIDKQHKTVRRRYPYSPTTYLVWRNLVNEDTPLINSQLMITQ